MRSLAFAAALLVGACAAGRAEDAAPTAPAGAAADAPKKTPPPPKQKAGPVVDEAEFRRYFHEDADEAWALYQDWPEAWGPREQWAMAFNDMKEEPEDGARAGERRMFFLNNRDRFKQEIATRRTKTSLGDANARAGKTAGDCAGKVVTEEGCVEGAVQGSLDTSKIAIDTSKIDSSVQGGLALRAGLQGPPPPDAKETKDAPVINEAFKTVLKGAALGGMAGALVGVGLMPLLGPVGIFIFALVGAAVMVATKKLSS